MTLNEPERERLPLHSFRVDDELWVSARTIAGLRHESLSAVLRSSLRSYVRRHQQLLPSRQEASSEPSATVQRRESDQSAGQDAAEEHGATG